MKHKLEFVTAAGTWVLAFCAIIAIYQTANTQRETAELNAKAAEYYDRQNQAQQPSFHIENKTLPEYEGFSQKLQLPIPVFGPDKFIKDIRVYNDGCRVKTLSVEIETYVVLAALDVANLLDNESFVMCVPIKNYYAGFEQNSQVQGLVAVGGTSQFQQQVYDAIIRYNSKAKNGKMLLGYPIDLVAFQYDDLNGKKSKAVYSSGMEIGNIMDDAEELNDSKEIFKGKRFTIDTFDIDKIMKDYAPLFIEREKVRSEKRKAERAAKSKN